MSRPFVKHITANFTVNPRNLDQTIISDSAADLVVTLPPSNHASKGMRVTCVQRSLSAGTGFAVDPQDADKILGQTIAGVSIDPGAGKKLINTGATDVLGDRVTLQADGNGKWYVTGLQGIWAGE